MDFSKRSDWKLDPNPLAKLLASKRERKETLIDLTESNPTRCGFKAPRLESLSDPKNLIYDPDPHGMLEARQALCRYYAERKVLIGPEQIFLTASTSEASSFLFRLLMNPGESLLVPRPSYPLMDYLAGLNDVQLDAYSLKYQNDWAMDLESLEEGFGRKPKAVLVVNPNNPTGNFVKENEWNAIHRLCLKNQTAVISDEVFFDYDFGEKSQVPVGAREDAPVLTFTLSGLSKVAAMPQMKLSWIVVNGPERLRAEAIQRLEVISDTYLSVNTPSQRALAEWLEFSKTIQPEITTRISANQSHLAKALEGSRKIALLSSQGGWFAVLKLSSGAEDESTAIRLLEEKNVCVHPGYFFDFDRGNFLVLSLLPPERHFKEGVASLVDTVV